MSGDVKSLLPANATALERAIEAAQARLADVPVPVDTLWDPWRCPAQLLPWLAWAWSVDEWDPAWPEEVRRRVIAAAPEVHRRKGTRAAVERALRAIGVVADIVEWWQAQPTGVPGTFSITAWVNEQLAVGGAVLTDKVQRQIDAIVRRTKPVSRAYDLLVGVLFGLRAGTAAVQRAVDCERRLVAVSVPPVVEHLGSASISRQIEMERQAVAAEVPASTGHLGAVALLRGIEVDRRTMMTEVI